MALLNREEVKKLERKVSAPGGHPVKDRYFYRLWCHFVEVISSPGMKNMGLQWHQGNYSSICGLMCLFLLLSRGNITEFRDLTIVQKTSFTQGQPFL